MLTDTITLNTAHSYKYQLVGSTYHSHKELHAPVINLNLEYIQAMQ